METILIVEDSATQAGALEHTLAESGYECIVAEDGAGGLERVRDGGIDLVISDVVMPEMDGFQLTRKIKGDPATRRTPVILLTSLTDPMHMVNALQCGADNFVTKPFEKESLLRRIRAILGPSRTSSRSSNDLELFGTQVTIDSGRKNILKMLVTSFEDSYRANQELARNRKELATANAKLEVYNRRLEGKVLQVEEKYRALMMYARDAIIIVRGGVSAAIVDANMEMERMTGRPLEQLVGLHPLNLYLPEDQDQARAFLRQLAESGFLDRTEARLLGPEGTTVDVEFSSSAVTIAGETVYMTIYRDIAPRRKAQRAIRESEERYRRLTESVPDVIFRVRFTPELATEYMSPRIEEMSGYPPQAYYDDPNFALNQIHPEDRHMLAALRSDPLSAPKFLTMRRQHRDGHYVWTEQTTGVVTDEQGVATGVEGTIRDVTAHREMEAQLVSAQRMEAIGRLAGGIAHDFNNLLAVIISYSTFLRDAFEPGNRALEDVQAIEDAAARAASLTRQLLAFSRRQVLSLEVVDLNQMVSDLHKLVERVIGEHITFDAKLDPDLGSVKADQSQIEQIIMNLVVNARDAMPEGGYITLETQNVDLGADSIGGHAELAPGKYVLISVTDTGTGMDEETQRRIFEPFFTTKSEGKGTGLGLATVFGNVKQIEGGVYVYSELGHGTTFKIYLPRTDADPENDHSSSEAPNSLKGTETVLVVEDDEHVRTAACRILRGAGYTVLEARNGMEGLQISRQEQQRINLVLSDMVMPEMGGPQMLKNMRCEGMSMPVLLMSGYPGEAAVRQATDEENSGIIQKPFSPVVLLKKVRDGLDDQTPAAVSTQPCDPVQSGA